jgi:hypothetical protein
MILHVALFRMPPLKLPENSVINDVNAVPSPAAPILIGLTLDRWCSWFLDLAPIIDAANETASRAVLIRYASQPNTVWPMVPDQGAWGVLLESPFAAPSRDALFFWLRLPSSPAPPKSGGAGLLTGTRHAAEIAARTALRKGRLP